SRQACCAPYHAISASAAMASASAISRSACCTRIGRLLVNMSMATCSPVRNAAGIASSAAHITASCIKSTVPGTPASDTERRAMSATVISTAASSSTWAALARRSARERSRATSSVIGRAPPCLLLDLADLANHLGEDLAHVLDALLLLGEVLLDHRL